MIDPGSTLNVVMFAAEAFPFVKVGGLGDVVGSLARVLKKLGTQVTLVLPAYKIIPRETFELRRFDPIPGFSVAMGVGSVVAEVYRTTIPKSEVEVFLIGSSEFFHRDGVYDDPVTKEGYPDNMERFVFFMKAGLDLIYRLRRPVDIIHCNDSQTGLIPGLVRINWGRDAFFSRVGTLFTIHNLAHQGIFPKDSLGLAGIDSRHFYPASPFEFWGKVNFMKAGVVYADLLNTVSETYAKEIQSGPEFGYGLEGVLRDRKDEVFGIVNGIDPKEWDPENDPLIPAHYSARDPSGKVVCKMELLKAFGLPLARGRIPLIGIVSRLAEQKGFDLIERAAEDIASLDLQLVVLGNGQRKYHEMLEKMAAQHPRKIGVKSCFDNRLAHLVEAGADIFLMPSRYEPCGLNQLYSLRYGTVPVVRATGGLVDTVTNYNLATDTGTGFTFKNYSPQDMLIALKRALMIYSDPTRWRALMVRDMAQDWSWTRSAEKYLELYRRIYKKRRGNPPSG